MMMFVVDGAVRLFAPRLPAPVTFADESNSNRG
jgi:hypothetical protein